MPVPGFRTIRLPDGSGANGKAHAQAHHGRPAGRVNPVQGGQHVVLLRGEMPGTPKPDAIVLILDATNLSRHLVLAARVIAQGLPTLVLLNMSDSLKAQGGSVDVLALARELGNPVALISAAKGEGIDVVQRFLSVKGSTAAPFEIPVININDVAQCREWACTVTKNSAYRKPLPSAWTKRLDSV